MLNDTLLQLAYETEQRAIAAVLQQQPGYHLLNFGCLFPPELLQQSLISHHIVVQEHPYSPGTSASLYAHYTSLPLLPNSIDIAVLAHVLETVPENKLTPLLQELWQCLIPEGRAIISVFKPMSLWKLYNLLLPRKRVLADFHSISHSAILSALIHQGFVLEEYKTLGFSLPLQQDKWRRRMNFLEVIGNFCWPSLGAIGVYTVRKVEPGMIPLRPQWHLEKVSLPSGVAEPSARKFESE